MTPMQHTLFDEFWSLIRKIERDIHEIGHTSGGDSIHWWFWELEDAYEAIMPLLFSISHPQQFYAPDAQTEIGGPFKAENAHEALVSCLSSEADLTGLINLLDSPEYKELRSKAADENRQLDALEHVPVALLVLPKVGAAIWDEEYEPRWELATIEPSKEVLILNLTDTQRRIYNIVGETPQRGQAIATLADCEFDTARKYLPRLVKSDVIKKCPAGYYREP